MKLKVSTRGENLKSVSVTLSPMDLRNLKVMATHYRTTRSEIIRASIRAAYEDFEKPDTNSAQLAFDFFGGR